MDSVLKAIAVYAVLWLMIRLSGRRTLGEMSTFDLILFLVVGGATQRALIGQDYSLTNAFVVVATLFTVDIAVGFLEWHFPAIARIDKGAPLILVEHGKPLGDRMRRARIAESDVMEAARMLHGLETLEQIKFAILEANGDISIIPREKPAKATRKKAAPARQT